MKVYILLTLLGLALSQNCLNGVNLAGLEFGSAYPGVYGKDYINPNSGEIDYFVSKGMNIFRLPFAWERMQLSANAELNETYLQYVTDIVQYATSKGAHVLIDPHNYARYYGKVIGSPGAATGSDFANFWSQLAKIFMNNANVIFGLMNEPNTMATELWLADANAAIAGIRAVGAQNLILVPGNAWTSASGWNQNWYGTPNGVVMKGVLDPLNNYAFEIHQYLDTDGSGTHVECVSEDIGVQRLTDFTGWARTQKVRAFLGEFAGGNTPTCSAAISGMLDFMKNNTDVFIGWSWWSGGPWWADYMYALDPSNGQDRPQMALLLPHLSPNNC